MAESSKKQSKYPSLYQVNTRVWLTELSSTLGRKATLDDIPDAELNRLADMGFDWIWFLSVWTTGKGGRKISLENTEWRRDFETTLPDLREEDIEGSGFAIAEYHVHPALGGDAALKRLHTKLRKRGFKLMLDFIPNHMGPDHKWVEDHPEYFVHGTESDLMEYPQNYIRIKRREDELILAYGRDPYFAGWPDTLQLDYSNPATAEAMTKELRRISGQCDGVRCDMAMLVLPEVFQNTWGRMAQPFWTNAIKLVRENNPGFCFMAEVYWDMEWNMHQQGFDYAYDKRLYDRLQAGNPDTVRAHFLAGLDYQDRLARFLENHDEPRAASAFNQQKHEAAAVLTFFSPGLRFFHQGQLEGRKKRISPHLVRAPKEPIDVDLHMFYTKLISNLKNHVFRNGWWHLLQCDPAWDGNGTWDAFLVFSWEGNHGVRMLVTVNFAPHASQCYVLLPFPDLVGHEVQLRDTMGTILYDRNGSELLVKGLYLDLPAWGYHIFEVNVSSRKSEV
jgi:hypothetical protein